MTPNKGAIANHLQEERIDTLRASFPEGGLFAGKQWLLSPKPLPLSRKTVEQLERLGHQLAMFQSAANTLYRQSVKGKAPAWLASYLDAGKPQSIINSGRCPALWEELPRIIRPDLIWGESGFSITELDSVPGGIGLTAWLSKAFSVFESSVIGGPDGMAQGFHSILPDGADIVISEESADYRPEMTWFSRQLNKLYGNDAYRVCDAENYQPDHRAVYRFFELFDYKNIPAANALFQAAAKGKINLTPPCKAYLEEKMWMALFWSRPLRGFWSAQLRATLRQRLSDYFPYSWILDPAPVPHHAELPRLGITNWLQLSEFSQKDRALVLKMSGFSEQAWGSRSVRIGEDLPADQWQEAVERALHDFPDQPWVMQEFKRAKVFNHPFWDESTGSIHEMPVRALLRPYYFLSGKNSAKPEAKLSGILATLVPSDKKIIHGMSDAILVPCTLQSA